MGLILAAAGGAIVIVGNSPHYYHRIVDYWHKKTFTDFTDVTGMHYQVAASLRGISEAIGIPITHVMQAISGSIVLFVLGAAGVVLLAFYKRSSLLMWEMLFLGLGATALGVRFTTFAIPVIAIGLFFGLFALLPRVLPARKNIPVFVAASGILAFTAWVMLSYNAILRPVYLSDEAAALAKLEKIGSADDFVLAWWDDGWLLWYVTGKRTVIDNGKHDVDNFLVAKIFFSANPYLSANMSRYFLEAYAKAYNRESIVTRVAQTEDMQKLLRQLSQPAPSKQGTFDIYYYFDDTLIEKLPAIAAFAKISGYDPFANEILSYTYLAKPFQPQDLYVNGKGFVFDRRSGIIRTTDGQQGQVGRLIISDGKRQQVQRFFRDADYNLIVYKNKYVLMVSDAYLNTFVIKGLILNQFDPNLFELIDATENGKILRLK